MQLFICSYLVFPDIGNGKVVIISSLFDILKEVYSLFIILAKTSLPTRGDANEYKTLFPLGIKLFDTISKKL